MATHYDITTVTSLPSTQDAARDALERSGTPTLVVAERQVAGRGRAGREWLEPTVGMFSSFAFDQRDLGSAMGPIPLCTGLAVRRAIGGGEVDLKWPNDLLIRGKKVGGILVEAVDRTVVIGCGVNLWWPDAPSFASAVHHETPPDGAAVDLAKGWVGEFLSIAAGPAWPLDEYREACVTIGVPVRWDGGVGVAVDVAEDGTLVVDAPDGRTRVLSGDVHLLPTS